MFAGPSAVFGPEAIHLAHIAGGSESVNLVLAQEFHQLGELVVGEQGFQLDGLLVGIAADDLIEGTATVEVVDDVATDAVIVLGDDAHTLALVEVGGEHVHYHAVDPSGDKADDDHLEGVDGESREADDGTRHAHRLTHVEVQVLVDDLGQDVKAARGGVDGEHQGLGGAEDDDAAEQVEPGVAHHGIGRTGINTHINQVFVRGGQVFPGVEPFAELGHGTEDQSAIDGLEAEFFADEQIGQHQQDGVEYAKEVLNKLPMEFAVEAQKLLSVSLEGTVG